MAAVACRQSISAFRLLKKVSTAALSKQFPLSDMDGIILYSVCFFWKSCEQYWLQHQGNDGWRL